MDINRDYLPTMSIGNVDGIDRVDGANASPDTWQAIMFKCIGDLAREYAQGNITYTIDGDFIFADTKEGEVKKSWDVNLASWVVYKTEGKRRYKCRMNNNELVWVLTFLAKTPVTNAVEINAAKVAGNTVVIPAWCDNTPVVMTVDISKWTISLGPYAAVGGVHYSPGRYASLYCPPTTPLKDPRAVRKAVTDMVATYGTSLTTLAILPYINPVFQKRYVPLVLGRMRSGKTSILQSIRPIWPHNTIQVSSPSTAAARNLLVTHHLIADDVAESVNTPFDYTLIVAYFDRNEIPRVRTSDLKVTSYPLRGTLAMATNNPQISLTSISDRVIIVDVDKVKAAVGLPVSIKPEIEPSWFILSPLFLGVPTTLFSYMAGIRAEVTDIKNQIDEPTKIVLENMDPMVYFYRWLYYRLAKLRANDCRGRGVKVIENDYWASFDVRYIPHPSVGDVVSVTVSRTLSASDSEYSVSFGTARQKYGVIQVRFYLERLNIPYRSQGNVFMVPCSRIDDIIEVLRPYSDKGPAVPTNGHEVINPAGN